MTMPARPPVQIPETKDQMRGMLMQAVAMDPSGRTVADLVLAFVALARSQGEIAGIDRTDKAITAILARTPTWSQPT